MSNSKNVVVRRSADHDAASRFRCSNGALELSQVALKHEMIPKIPEDGPKKLRLQNPQETNGTLKSKAKRQKQKQKALAKVKYLKAKVCSRLRVVILEMILGRVQMSKRECEGSQQQRAEAARCSGSSSSSSGCYVKRCS
jgi:hypothetical protein